MDFIYSLVRFDSPIFGGGHTSIYSLVRFDSPIFGGGHTSIGLPRTICFGVY